MPRESKAKKRERALEVASRMNKRYTEMDAFLEYVDPFTLTIVVMLSAQTTDKAVNKVSPELFGRWPDAQSMAGADPLEIEKIIRTIGFFRIKAKNCVACAQMICSRFGGEVPSTMEELMELPGVGRKTANIVLNEAFSIIEGIAVDTHVFRIAHKLHFSAAKTSDETESDLLVLFPQESWRPINKQFVEFGREVCIARHPKCVECPLNDLCPSAEIS